jgi:hypothetical protein
MDLVDLAVLIFGIYVIGVIAAALLMALRSGRGTQQAILAEQPSEPAPVELRQQSGVMPPKAWGWRPPVEHSRYEPAEWQVQPPSSDEDSLENVDRATLIKRELGSEHPPWERLDRQGL